MVVGGGISGAGHVVELAQVATTRWITRRPPVWRDQDFTAEHGRAVIERVQARVREGRRARSVVAETGLLDRGRFAAARRAGALERHPRRLTVPRTAAATAVAVPLAVALSLGTFNLVGALLVAIGTYVIAVPVSLKLIPRDTIPSAPALAGVGAVAAAATIVGGTAVIDGRIDWQEVLFVGGYSAAFGAIGGAIVAWIERRMRSGAIASPLVVSALLTAVVAGAFAVLYN